jgi:hypothetical protein
MSKTKIKKMPMQMVLAMPAITMMITMALIMFLTIAKSFTTQTKSIAMPI